MIKETACKQQQKSGKYAQKTGRKFSDLQRNGQKYTKKAKKPL